jgi:fructose-bisphosphate aldolase, class I
VSALGKATRLNRILAGRTRRVLTVAVDHMINYPIGFPVELRRIAATLGKVIEGKADAVTMNKGTAMRLMEPYAGRVPLIIQSMALRPDEPDFADSATVEETLGLGADAIAVAMFVYGETELAYIRHLAHVVRCAAPFGLPVIPHIYPLESGDEKHTVVHDPEYVHYAARVGFEMGADLVKVPYTGDVASFRDIVSDIPVPVVSAGGPKCPTLDDAVRMARDIGHAGAAGATMGRNVWGFDDIPAAIQRLKAAINEG